MLGHPSAISFVLDPTRVITDTALSNVQDVGKSFLYGCSLLKEVDLSPLSNVKKVGGWLPLWMLEPHQGDFTRIPF